MNLLEESDNPVVQKSNRTRQIYEVGVLLFLTLAICGIFVLQGWVLILWSGLCLFVATSSYLLALRACNAAIREYCNAKYEIGCSRLRTLEAVGVPKDVTAFLSGSVEKEFKNEGELSAHLQEALGPERTREVKSVILKYARV